MYSTFSNAAANKHIVMPAAGHRKKMNVIPMLLGLFFPWLVYSIIFAVLSFYYHYKFAYIVYAVVGIVLMIVVLTGAVALEACKGIGGTAEPHWYIFIFATSMLAWVVGVTCGDYNFYYNMQPYYDVVSLNMYDGVDPSRVQGVELMDAGRIIFTGRTKLDLQKAAGFRNSHTYCVAPITINQGNVSTKPLLRYDFWAVGLDCCGDRDFRCGAFDNPRAHSGLRMLRDDQRAFFRLAVQQAEAAYGIKSVHPLFFEWLMDPSQEALRYQEDGFRWYFIGMFSYFCWQLLLTGGAVKLFVRMERWSFY